MQLGDLICILFGAKTPVILREVPAESSYEWIGHAYVHGIMHGQALGSVSAEVDRQGRRTLGFKDFRLI